MGGGTVAEDILFRFPITGHYVHPWHNEALNLLEDQDEADKQRPD